MTHACIKETRISPWLFLLPSVFGIAVTYGIGRYAYGFFLPVFIERYDLSLSYTGYLSSAATTAYAIVSLVSVFYANKIRPIFLIVSGGGVVTIGISLVTVSPDYLSFSAGIVLASLGAGIMPPAYFEYIGKAVRENKRDLVTIIVSTGGAPGLVLSAVCAYQFLEEWQSAWFSFSLISLAMLLLNVFLLPWGKIHAPKVSPNILAEGIRELFPKGWAMLFAMSFFYGIALNVYYTFSVSFIDLELGVKSFTYLFWSLVGVSGLLAFLVTAFLISKLGVIATIAVSYLFLSISFFIFELWNVNSILISGVVFGVFSIVPNSACLVFANHIYNDRLSLGWGMTFISLSLGMAFGVAVAGNIAEQHGLGTAFEVTAIFMAFLSAVLWIYVKAGKGGANYA
ncbi:MAG: MFS transporter [Hyphomicrobiales bacterium]|nr:MFS transporter [Hyphomicrobiales bacterium]